MDQNSLLTYVVYSHTDYLDILEIQSEYVTSNRSNCILCINKNNLELDYLYARYQQVIFYNDYDTYATRLSYCISQLNCEYFLFMHDIDILLHCDDDVVNIIHQAMLVENIDRVDLKYTDNMNCSMLYDLTAYIGQTTLLVKQEDAHSYVYNVNPSIWKKSCLLEILNNFPHKTYRNIEDLDVQIFCKQFNIYKLHTATKVSCGHFDCVDFFMYFHISHGGRLVPLNETYTTIYNQPYSDVKEHYIQIVDKYNLKNSKKWNN